MYSRISNRAVCCSVIIFRAAAAESDCVCQGVTKPNKMPVTIIASARHAAIVFGDTHHKRRAAPAVKMKMLNSDTHRFGHAYPKSWPCTKVLYAIPCSANRSEEHTS